MALVNVSLHHPQYARDGDARHTPPRRGRIMCGVIHAWDPWTCTPACAGNDQTHSLCTASCGWGLARPGHTLALEGTCVVGTFPAKLLWGVLKCPWSFCHFRKVHTRREPPLAMVTVPDSLGQGGRAHCAGSPPPSSRGLEAASGRTQA